MSLETPDPNDRAHFLLTCDVNPNVTSIRKVTFMRIRHVKRGSRSSRRWGYERPVIPDASDSETVAYANISARHRNVIANETFARRGMVISGSIDQSEPAKSTLKIESGICEHGGDYLCEVFYEEGNGDDRKFTVAEKTVPNACGKMTCILSAASLCLVCQLHC